jgi:hypothetical protein
MTTEIEGGSFANLEDDDAMFEALANGGEIPTEGETQEQGDPLPAEAEQPKAEEAPAVQQPAAQEQPQETHRVPLRELLDERERRQAAERQFEELRRQFEETRRKQEEAAKKQPVPEFWEKPEDSIQYRIQQEISPLREMQAQFEQALAAQREQFSRMQAASQHGEQAVNDAYAELSQRMKSDPSARYDYQRIMESPHPYGALVEWHKREQAMKEFGSDPNAYREKLSASLLDDPAFLAKALERAQAQARGAQQPPVVTRTKSLPSVSKMGAAAPLTQQGDDLDDDALFERLAAKK